jgi:zinc protease
MRGVCNTIAALATVCLCLLSGQAGAMDIRQVTTPLGVTAWLVRDNSVPVLTLSFSFEGGAASEPETQKGVTSLMAELLTDGAGDLQAQAFMRRAEDAHVSFGFGASADRLSGSLSTLSANRAEAFELLRLSLNEPRFDSDMVEQRRAQFIAGINQANQRPASVASRTLLANVFAHHPYSIEAQGVRDGLKAISVDDIRKRAKALLDRSGLIVAAVGDIDEAELVRLLDRAFGDLPAGPHKTELPDWTPPTRPVLTVIERPVPQSVVQMALPGIRRQDPDWYAALMMNHILGGGGQQSRLFTEVREKRGLAYSVSSGLRTYRKASLLTVSTASANEKVAETIRVIRGEMARLRNDGATEQELADAKAYLSGALPVSLDSSGSIANLLHGMQVDGLPPEQLDRRPKLIGAVTLEDVRRLARRLLREDSLTTVVVGKPIGLAAEPQ